MSEAENEKYLIVAINKRTERPQLVSEIEGMINMPELGNDFWSSFKTTLSKELLPMRDNHFVKLTRPEFEKRLEEWKTNGVTKNNNDLTESLLDPNFENIKNEQPRPHKLDESKINWNSIEKNLGVTREQLRVSGALDQLLLGEKTTRLFDIKVKVGNEIAIGKGRLYLKEGANGMIYMNSIPKLDKPQLDVPYFKHTFTDTEKTNLLKSGNAGNLITITQSDGKEKDVFVSLDPETNQLVNASLKSIYIQDKTMGMELDKNMLEELKLGHPISLVGNKNGKSWEADVQINAFTRRVDFVQDYATQQKRSERMIGGVSINDDQWDQLCEGKRLPLTGIEVNVYQRDGKGHFVKDEKDNKIPIGKSKCNGWAYLENGKPKIEFTREICGLSLSHDQHMRIEAREELYLFNMTGKPKNEGEVGKKFNGYVSLGVDGKCQFDLNRVYISQKPKIKLDGKEYQIELAKENITDLYAGSVVQVTIKDAKQKDVNIWLRVDTEDSGKQRLKPYSSEPEVQAKHTNEAKDLKQDGDKLKPEKKKSKKVSTGSSL